jgi:hypothetical protein
MFRQSFEDFVLEEENRLFGQLLQSSEPYFRINGHNCEEEVAIGVSAVVG